MLTFFFLLLCLRYYSFVFWHPLFPLENSVVPLISIPLKLIIFFIFYFFWLLLEFYFCLRCSIFYFVVSRCVSIFIFLRGFRSILESVAYCTESFMKNSHLFSWILSFIFFLFSSETPTGCILHIFSALYVFTKCFHSFSPFISVIFW